MIGHPRLTPLSDILLGFSILLLGTHLLRYFIHLAWVIGLVTIFLTSILVVLPTVALSIAVARIQSFLAFSHLTLTAPPRRVTHVGTVSMYRISVYVRM